MPSPARPLLFAALSVLSCVGRCASSDSGAASTTSVAATATPSSPSAGPSASALGLEVDIIYPQNRTYNASDEFPLAFALQNMSSVLKTYGSGYLSWGIMPWGDGNQPAGSLINSASGEYTIPEGSPTGEPLIVSDYANVSAWPRGWDSSGIVLNLEWNLWSYDPSDKACHDNLITSGFFFFSVLSPDSRWAFQGQQENVTLLAPDISNAPRCPAFAGAVDIAKRPANASTCQFYPANATTSSQPCDVTVDASVRSSISSAIAHKVAAATATTSTAPAASDTSGAQQQAVVMSPVLAAMIALAL